MFIELKQVKKLGMDLRIYNNKEICVCVDYILVKVFVLNVEMTGMSGSDVIVIKRFSFNPIILIEKLVELQAMQFIKFIHKLVLKYVKRKKRTSCSERMV